MARIIPHEYTLRLSEAAIHVHAAVIYLMIFAMPMQYRGWSLSTEAGREAFCRDTGPVILCDTVAVVGVKVLDFAWDLR